MRGDISYDLVMQDDMEFVEGSYRMHGEDWKVFIIRKVAIEIVEIKSSQWSSGVSGLVIRLPRAVQLNKMVVEEILSKWLGVDEWNEVHGPDSMQLR